MLTFNRKRAKTDDEKEQRRVERVLRNRRAAQSSRERKRQESDALAKRNKELEQAIHMLSKRNEALEMELKKVKPDFIAGALVTASSPTLSRDLFTPPAPKPQEAEEDMEQSRKISHGTNDLIQNIIKRTQSPPTTINPASLSPATSPAPEDLDFALGPQAPERELDMFEARKDSTTRLTQYSAAVLCPDLLCQRPVESPTPSMPMSPRLPRLASRTQTSTSLALATSPPQSLAYLISIILLVTNSLRATLNSSTSSTSPPCTKATAPSTTSSSSKKTLRLKTLRKLLTSNRKLARPLQDATLAVLRWQLSRNEQAEVDAQELASPWMGDSSLMRVWMDNGPSWECLMALTFAIRQLKTRIERKETLQQVTSSDLLSGKLARRQGTRGNGWQTAKRPATMSGVQLDDSVVEDDQALPTIIRGF